MTTRLAPYGSEAYAQHLAKVGKGKTPGSLVSRMPSPDIVAKVGAKGATPASLAARMPSPEIAAKVGIKLPMVEGRQHRVVRRNERS